MHSTMRQSTAALRHRETRQQQHHIRTQRHHQERGRRKNQRNRRRNRNKERRHAIRVSAVAVHRKNREDSHHHEVHALQTAEEARAQHIPEDYAQNPRHVNQHVHPQNARPRTLITIGTGVNRERLIAKSVNRQSLSPKTLHAVQRVGKTVHQMARIHQEYRQRNRRQGRASADHAHHEELHRTGKN